MTTPEAEGPQPLNKAEIEQVRVDLEHRLPDGAIPAGSIRGHPHYWCSQGCEDEDCTFGPCGQGDLLFREQTVARLVASFDASEVARRRYEKALRWIQGYAHSYPWTTIAEQAQLAVESPEETLTRLAALSDDPEQPKKDSSTL